MNAVVAVLLSAASVEAFINELGEWAETWKGAPIHSSQATFGALWREAEDSRGSIRLKVLLAGHAFVGSSYPRGAEPFQSFDFLFKLRDAMVHLKLEASTRSPSGDVESDTHESILKHADHRSLTVEDPKHRRGGQTWIALLSTPAAALWACNAASAIVLLVLDSIPESTFRDSVDWIRNNFQPVEPRAPG